MNEFQERHMIAVQSAHAMLIGFLLRAQFKDMDEEGIDLVAEALRKMVRATDHFEGATKGDELKSERLADTVIQMQEHAVKLIDNAAAGAKEVVRRNPGSRR